MRSGVAIAALAVAGASAGCAPRGRAVDDYFPLGVGHRWVYEVTAPGKARTLLEFRIVGERSGDRGERRFLLDDTGERYYLRHGEVVAYSISPGIWTVFLEGPLSRGRRFDGARSDDAGFHVAGEETATPAPGATPKAMRAVRSSGYKIVTATRRSVTVPAGSFADCLEVTHVAGPTLGVKYFAPGVGMVFAEAWYEDAKRNTRTLITRQELVRYEVAGRSGGDAGAAATGRAISTTTAGTVAP